MGVLSDELKEQIRANFPKYPNKRAVTLPALHLVHDALREVSTEAIVEIAELLELHPAEVRDTMTFYNFFKDETKPLGKHRLWVCRSISCMLRGGEEVLEKVCQKFHVHPGETSADGKVTLEFAECLGACEGAPCILVDDICHMDMTAESVSALIDRM
ncbi:MAG: NAD(P)H-dependent oxidoreductase subunit E [Planctomycetota bacterium]